MSDMVPFESLQPGDKFSTIGRYPVTAVIVHTPTVSRVVKRFLRQSVTYYTTNCVEIHPFLGACAWQPEFVEGQMVVLHTD